MGEIIPVVIWWLLSVIHGKNTFRSLGALNFRKLLSRTRDLYRFLFCQMLDNIIFGNNFFFLCGRMRCASFDKVVISSCLCHLSVQAISLSFPLILSSWLFPWLLLFSLQGKFQLSDCGESGCVCVWTSELVCFCFGYLCYVRFFPHEMALDDSDCDSYLWYEICLRLSESYEPRRTKVDWRYLYLTLANSARNGEILIFLHVFLFLASTYWRCWIPILTAHTHMHAYTLKMNAAKLRIVFVKKKKKNAAELQFYFFHSLIYLPIQHTQQNSTHFVWVAWHCLGFQKFVAFAFSEIVPSFSCCLWWWRCCCRWFIGIANDFPFDLLNAKCKCVSTKCKPSNSVFGWNRLYMCVFYSSLKYATVRRWDVLARLMSLWIFGDSCVNVKI